MQRRQFLQSALVGAGALLPGTGVAANQLTADSTSITGLVLPPLDVSVVNDLLIHFIESGQLEAVKSLLEQGADVNARDWNDKTPLHHAAKWEWHVDILECLISRGADVNAKDNDGWTVLHEAAENNPKAKPLQYLISQGADVNAKDNEGKTPLHQAAMGRQVFKLPTSKWNYNVDILKCLVSSGADVNVKDNGGRTPLHEAADCNPNVKSLQYLISQGADVNAKDNEGITPLDVADTTEVNKQFLDALNEDDENAEEKKRVLLEAGAEFTPFVNPLWL